MATNVMELFAKIGLDQKDFDKGLDSAGNKLKSFGKAIGGATAKVGGAALKMTGVALAGAATGVVALAKQSYSAYSEYQQMVGGVQKLYGNMGASLEDYAASVGKTTDEARADWERNEKAQELMMKNAKNAFKTSGMSANQYMEQATAFSAALINSLEGDTYKAAEMTDMAMKAISDNWNTFGGDMSMIQGAFQGFAKQNYTMLDNLKLGYGGTKSEMERLIADANEYAESMGLAADLSIDSFADIVQAIEYVQEKQHIAGTTSREAATTISGSFGTLKAAWQNLVTGFADPDADLGELISNVVESGSKAVENAIPTLIQALEGIGYAVENLAPIIGEKLPELFEKVVPPLLNAAHSLLGSFAEMVPQIVQIIGDELPYVVQTILPIAIDAIRMIFTTIADELPSLLQIISDNADVIFNGLEAIMESVGSILVELIPKLAEFIQKGIPKLLDFIKRNIGKIKSGLTTILKSVSDLFITLLPEILPVMVEIAVDLIQELATGFKENANDIVAGILQVVNVLIDTLLDPTVLMSLIDAAITIIVAISEALLENIDTLTEAVLKVIGLLIVAIVGSAPDILEGATTAFLNICTAIGNIVGDVLAAIGGVLGAFLGEDGIGGWGADILEKAITAFEAIGDAVWSALTNIWETLTSFGSAVWDAIVGGLGDLFQKGVDIVMDIVEGIKSVAHKINEAIWGEGAGTKVIEKANQKAQEMGYSSAQAYVEGQEKGYDINSPSKKMAYVGRMVMAGFAEGVEEESAPAFSDIDETFAKFSPEIGVMESDTKRGSASGDALSSLVSKLDEFMQKGMDITIPVFIGNKQIDEIYVDSSQRVTVRSGGQVNA